MRALLSAAASLVLAWTGVAAAAELEVAVHGVADDRGRVRVTLYDGPDGFLHERGSLRIRERPAAAGTVTARFEDLAPGRYAVIAYHDANGDGRMNRFLGMVPSEGYGLSNNPQVMGPPEFEQAAFGLPAGGGAVEVRLNY
ncbi:MAG TPA: DUF2141 domain-containing protein [Gammaproteobacteria bacterium]|nr:DUF2141 domain-containing protein [Gammaproteobacteria bacterium]